MLEKHRDTWASLNCAASYVHHAWPSIVPGCGLCKALKIASFSLPSRSTALSSAACLHCIFECLQNTWNRLKLAAKKRNWELQACEEKMVELTFAGWKGEGAAAGSVAEQLQQHVARRAGGCRPSREAPSHAESSPGEVL